MLPNLPSAETRVRQVIAPGVGANAGKAVQLMFRVPDRVFYLVQNQSTTQYLAISNGQDGGNYEVLPPTGAKLIDLPSTNELWVRNLTLTADATIAVEEIIGYSQLQLRQLYATERLCDLMEKLLNSGARP